MTAFKRRFVTVLPPTRWKRQRSPDPGTRGRRHRCSNWLTHRGGMVTATNDPCARGGLARPSGGHAM